MDADIQNLLPSEVTGLLLSGDGDDSSRWESKSARKSQGTPIGFDHLADDVWSGKFEVPGGTGPQAGNVSGLKGLAE